MLPETQIFRAKERPTMTGRRRTGSAIVRLVLQKVPCNWHGQGIVHSKATAQVDKTLPCSHYFSHIVISFIYRY